jgi:glyoxylase-like metal-dependent hydrolase (beta-lactamase superfamily II)
MSLRLTRRVFLTDLGKTGLAVAVLGVACSEPAAEGGEGWRRVDLGSVSAYVIARNGEAVVVDTGVAGSADSIETAVGGLGLTWSDVGYVALTHAHPDHVGSLAEVLESAPDATAYIGAGDADAVTSPRPLSTVGDGDRVMGLQVIETPGHTPGHLSFLDSDLDLLLAGDALVGADGGVGGPDPRFSDDMAVAVGSVAKLAELSFDTVVFGHGEPVEGDASAGVGDLVDTG